MLTTDTIWIATGFLGQGLFFGRWIVQWLASERSASSKVPISFWYLSLIGGLITLIGALQYTFATGTTGTSTVAGGTPLTWSPGETRGATGRGVATAFRPHEALT